MNALTQEPPPVAEKLREWMNRAVIAGASDLHLIAGYPPVLRLHGDLVELPDLPLQGEQTHALLRELCPPEIFARLQAQKNVDFSFDLPVQGELSRFRANEFHAGQ